MRKLLIILAVILASAGLRAQTHYVPHVWVGAHAGMTLSEVSFSPSVRQTFGQGFTGGFSFRFAEERHVGLLAELNIAQRGWKEDFEESPLEYQRRTTYVALPIMTHIFFGKPRAKCFFNLGPEVSIMLSESTTANFDYNNPLAVEGFPANRMTEQMSTPVKNKFDYGITAGVGGEFLISRQHSVFIEARYYFGLGNIFPASKKDTFSASRNSSISITAGYYFRLK